MLRPRIAHQHGKMRERRVINKTRGLSTGLSAITVIDFSEHTDGGQRITASLEEVFIEAQILAIQDTRPDLLQNEDKWLRSDCSVISAGVGPTANLPLNCSASTHRCGLPSSPRGISSTK